MHLVRSTNGGVSLSLIPGFFLFSVLSTPLLAGAGTIHVTNPDDSGPGTLREAVAQANSTTGSAQILIAADLGPIVLTGGQLEITQALTISGPVEGQTISGNATDRIFSVQTVDTPLALHNLVLTDGLTTLDEYSVPGHCHSDTGGGGAICSLSNVQIHDSVLLNNATQGDYSSGGAVFVNGADVLVSNSTLAENFTLGPQAAGGAIWVRNGNLTVYQSTLSANATYGDGALGGGLFHDAPGFQFELINGFITNNATNSDSAHGGGVAIERAGMALIANSMIAGNMINGIGSGGGVYLRVSDGLVSNSTITRNGIASSGSGGGIRGSAPAGGFELQILNSTVSGNSISDELSRGGGISVSNMNLDLRNSTVTDNESNQGAGIAIHAWHPFGVYLRPVFDSVILAGNQGPDGNLFLDGFGTAGIIDLSVSYSLVGTDLSSDVDPASQNVFSDDPGLAVLGDNGCAEPAGSPGFQVCVETHALEPDSLARNAASNSHGLSHDQRGPGFPRIQGGRTDIGSFEATVQGQQAAVPVPVTGPAGILILSLMTLLLAGLGMRSSGRT